MILSAQKPSTDAVPSLLRDLIPVRLAFRCSTGDASDTILGNGWASQGYSASSIPLHDRGVGFVLGESSVPKMFRSFWLDDDTQSEVLKAALELRGWSGSGDSGNTPDQPGSGDSGDSSDPVNPVNPADPSKDQK